MLRIAYLLLILVMSFGSLQDIFIADDSIRIDFLDVGQGDAVLISAEDGSRFLIDTGVDTAVIYALEELMLPWERKLDYVLITHADRDHIGGLDEILSRFEVRQVIMNPTLKDTREVDNVMAMLQIADIPVKEFYQGDEFMIGCCTEFSVLWPSLYEAGKIADENDKSIALALKVYENDVFLGGDLATEYENKATESVFHNFEIIKLGHHGSKHSSSELFLERMNADLAIISAGKNNRYGHPHSEVLENLTKTDTDYLSTSASGNISITFYPDKTLVECEKKCNYNQ